MIPMAFSPSRSAVAAAVADPLFRSAHSSVLRWAAMAMLAAMAAM
jgi:hypothetical protein